VDLEATIPLNPLKAQTATRESGATTVHALETSLETADKTQILPHMLIDADSRPSDTLSLSGTAAEQRSDAPQAKIRSKDTGSCARPRRNGLHFRGPTQKRQAAGGAKDPAVARD
jgi:hypothetical protein